MDEPKLDLSTLEAALASLKRLPLEGDVDDVHRDAAIQRSSTPIYFAGR